MFLCSAARPIPSFRAADAAEHFTIEISCLLTASGAQQQTTVVVTTPAIVGGEFGYNPVRVNCPHCHADVVTTVDHTVGGLAWMICGIIVLVGVFLLP